MSKRQGHDVASNGEDRKPYKLAKTIPTQPPDNNGNTVQNSTLFRQTHPDPSISEDRRREQQIIDFLKEQLADHKSAINTLQTIIKRKDNVIKDLKEQTEEKDSALTSQYNMVANQNLIIRSLVEKKREQIFKIKSLEDEVAEKKEILEHIQQAFLTMTYPLAQQIKTISRALLLSNYVNAQRNASNFVQSVAAAHPNQPQLQANAVMDMLRKAGANWTQSQPQLQANAVMDMLRKAGANWTQSQPQTPQQSQQQQQQQQQCLWPVLPAPALPSRYPQLMSNDDRPTLPAVAEESRQVGTSATQRNDDHPNPPQPSNAPQEGSYAGMEHQPGRGRANSTCELCKKVLSCPSALRLHYRIHTGERPYKCDVCDKSFAHKGNCVAHRRNVHKLEVETTSNQVSVGGAANVSIPSDHNQPDQPSCSSGSQ